MICHEFFSNNKTSQSSVIHTMHSPRRFHLLSKHRYIVISHDCRIKGVYTFPGESCCMAGSALVFYIHSAIKGKQCDSMKTLGWISIKIINNILLIHLQLKFIHHLMTFFKLFNFWYPTKYLTVKAVSVDLELKYTATVGLQMFSVAYNVSKQILLTLN